MFRLDVSHIMNEKGWAVSILNNQDIESKHITVNEKPDDRIAQQWDVVYADEWKGEPGKGELNEDFGLYIERPFYVVSALGSHRYLEVINSRNMVIKTKNSQKTQTWWFDQQSFTIKTKLNNQSWDITGGKGDQMRIYSTNSQWYQIFKFNGQQFTNVGKDEKVLAVDGSKDQEARKVIVSTSNGQVAQKWNVVYLDKAGKDETKGLNEEYGFHINRPFYFRSRMPMKRVIRCHGGGWMHLNRWVKNRKDQLFWFDEKTKTVRSE